MKKRQAKKNIKNAYAGYFIITEITKDSFTYQIDPTDE
jgi:hypothetical protein